MPKSIKGHAVTKKPEEDQVNSTAQRPPNLSVLLSEFPPWVTRTHPRFRELTGYSPRTVANFDAMKPSQGPSKRIMMGNVVAYEREALVAWLESRSRVL